MDFFISYTSADRQWAEWVAYSLEEAGYSVVLQAWDFRPGSNFVLEMQRAAKEAKRTVLILSPDYLKSQFASPEWAAAFSADPQGLKRTLLPIIVRACKPDGLLGQIVYLDISDLNQDAAKQALTAGVKSERGKPTTPPSFPGKSDIGDKSFPVTTGEASTKGSAYMPRVRGAVTDIEKRRFLNTAFESIREYFKRAATQLANSRNIDCDFQVISAIEFTSEIFLDGASVAACRIWQGGMFSEDGISYSEGRRNFGSNSVNEILGVTDASGEIALSAMLNSFAFGRATNDIDAKHMSPDQAAEYLWRRFVSRLER